MLPCSLLSKFLALCHTQHIVSIFTAAAEVKETTESHPENLEPFNYQSYHLDTTMLLVTCVCTGEFEIFYACICMDVLQNSFVIAKTLHYSKSPSPHPYYTVDISGYFSTMQSVVWKPLKFFYAVQRKNTEMLEF